MGIYSKRSSIIVCSSTDVLTEVLTPSRGTREGDTRFIIRFQSMRIDVHGCFDYEKTDDKCCQVLLRGHFLREMKSGARQAKAKEE